MSVSFTFESKLEKAGKALGIDLPYFFKNGGWMFLRQCVFIFSGFLLTVFFARLVSKSVYGEYQFLLTLIALFSILALPGFNFSIFRAVSRGYEGDYIHLVRKSFRWSLLGSIAFLFCSLLFYFNGQISLFYGALLVAFLFPFYLAPNTWENFMQGKSLFNLHARWGIIQMTATTAVTGAVIFLFRENLPLILLSYLGTYSSFNILFYFKSKGYLENKKKDAEALSYGQFLNKVSVLGAVVDSIDKLIVGIFSIQLLASYAIALTVLESLRNVIKNLFNVTFPKLANGAFLQKKHLLILLAVGMLGSALLYFSGEFFITTIFSDKYLDAVFFFKLTVFLLPFFMINSALSSQVFSQANNEKTIVKINFISPLMTLVISLGILLLFKDLVLFILSKLYCRQIFNLLFFLFGMKNKKI